MILVYLLFCIIIGLINNRTNIIYALLLGILGLNFFLNGNDLVEAAQALVAIPKTLLISPEAVLLLVVIILLFILSNLLNLINIDFIIDRYVGRFSYRKQQLFTFIISFFSTNLDFANSNISVHHRKVYDINSGIMPFLNIFSIVVIFISTLLVMFDAVNGISLGVATFIVLFNIPAIWWAYKTLIQIVYNKQPDYKINKYNMNLIRPSIDVAQSRVVQTTLSGPLFLKRVVILLPVSLIIALFIPQYKFFAFLILYIILIIAYTIYLGVKAVYEERIMPEEEIYRTIRNSMLGIGPELISFLLTLIFTSLSYDYIERFYANIYSSSQLFLLALIGLLIGMMLFKDYLIGLAMALPITLIWITSNYSIDEESIRVLYIALISLATLIQIFYLFKFDEFDKVMILDLLLLVVVTISTILIMLKAGISAGVTLFVVYAILYICVYMLMSRNSREN